MKHLGFGFGMFEFEVTEVTSDSEWPAAYISGCFCVMYRRRCIWVYSTLKSRVGTSGMHNTLQTNPKPKGDLRVCRVDVGVALIILLADNQRPMGL